jgi:hypothetical protein
VDLIFDAIEVGVAVYDWVRKRKRKPTDPAKKNRAKPPPQPGPIKQR